MGVTASQQRLEEERLDEASEEALEESIAVVGMAGRLPGADSPSELWNNLRQGKTSIRRFSVEELLAAGVDVKSVEDPDYVRAAGVVSEADCFDAGFFGFSPREASILDPQHRVFLECAWSSLEDAGYDPGTFDGAIGVYAGCFMNKYLLHNLYTNPRFLASPDAMFARVSNDKDFLATRVAYFCDLRGPSLTVQTACSTSLVATHLACQGLLSYDCDMALVGGVALNVPLLSGYRAVDGGFLTSDGECRPFDAAANGCLPGYGAGVVVLRRLADAMAARDHIRAVIRGTAINNDGSSKVGYTAPSVDAQASVVMAAQALAGVHPESIGYVEAHGTGTAVGDPIEVAGLSQAFRAHTDRRGFCALGSVKANLGHLDAAAGVASLMRAVLALEHGEIPPCANFENPNPKLELETTPFYVPTAAIPWPRDETPRRAGVSSLGVGGTNAHVVLQEAPAQAPTTEARPWQVLPISARGEEPLQAALDRLADHLEEHLQGSCCDLVNVAFTLQVGRRAFDQRRVLVCRDEEDAIEVLRSRDRQRLLRPLGTTDHRHVIFLFPGGGAQYPDMGLEVYRRESVFRQTIDQAAEHLRPLLRFDLRHHLYPSLGLGEVEGAQRPPVILASLVATSYAMARQWMAWGVTPQGMIGHSMGEYVAACLAGVFSFEQTLALAVERGKLFEAVPAGAMVVVQRSAAKLEPLLEGRLSLAAVNAPEVCLVSGPQHAIADLMRELAAADIEHQKVHIEVASHSFMMDPVLDRLADFVRRLAPQEPQIPFISGVTGTWIRPQEATDPDYWARHLRQTVRFSEGLCQLASDPQRVLLEVGPGNALCNLAAMQGFCPPPLALPSLRHAQDKQSDLAFLLTTVGKLWLAGVSIDWQAFHAPVRPRRVPLPTYAFERQRHWIEAGAVALAMADRPSEGATGTADGPLVSAAAEVPPRDPPRTSFEADLVDIWRDLLGLDEVGIHDDFFALGGHSLMATHLMRTLRHRFSVQLELRALFEAPTIATLAAWIEDSSGGKTAPTLDLVAEVVLDPTVVPAVGAVLGPPTLERSSAVLLTGATGFLGAFLCRELGRQTSADIICLVRAQHTEGALQRILQNLENYGCLEPGLERRLIPLPGDLGKPLLGLSPEAFEELSGRIDGVYHCGAWVNFAQPYRALKGSNVLGTQEILRLVVQGRPKVLHHVSTLAVLAGAVVRGDVVVPEDGPLPPAEGHDTGYSQSKWVSEGLIEIARSRGVAASIYRPGMVMGDSQSGVSNGDDYLTKMIEGCVRFGLAPLRDYPLAVATVDYVAAALVRLSLRPDAVGRSFHLIQPRPLPWNQLFALIRQCGYEVESVPYGRWLQELKTRLEGSGDAALEALLGLLSEAGDRTMPTFLMDNVRQGLADSGIEPPALDAECMGQYLRFFRQRGWITSPGGLVASG